MSVPQSDLSQHVFQTGVAMNRIAARAHRLEPNHGVIRQQLADARERFVDLTARHLYGLFPPPQRDEQPVPPYDEAPNEVQARYRRIARINHGLLNPTQETLARHSAQQASAAGQDPVQVYLDVLALSHTADYPGTVCADHPARRI